MAVLAAALTVACDPADGDGDGAGTASTTGDDGASTAMVATDDGPDDGGPDDDADGGESTAGPASTGPGGTDTDGTGTDGSDADGTDTDASESGTTQGEGSDSGTTTGEPGVCEAPVVDDACAELALPPDPGLGLIHAWRLSPEVLQFKEEGFDVCGDGQLQGLLACGECDDSSDGAYRLTFPAAIGPGSYSTDTGDFELESASSESLQGRNGCSAADDVIFDADVMVADANDACIVGTVNLAGVQYQFAAIDCP